MIVSRCAPSHSVQWLSATPVACYRGRSRGKRRIIWSVVWSRNSAQRTVHALNLRSCAPLGGKKLTRLFRR